MIGGYVNDALEAVVEIGLIRGDSATTIPAVVDTGFSGGICLSEENVGHVEMTFEYAETYELANGEVIVKDVFRGTIVFDGRVHEVDLIFTASQDSLIGASLLKDHRPSSVILSVPFESNSTNYRQNKRGNQATSHIDDPPASDFTLKSWAGPLPVSRT